MSERDEGKVTEPGESAAEDAPAAAPGGAPGPAEALRIGFSCSANLGSWLRQNRISLAVSSYQTGLLFLVGALPQGRLSIHQHRFRKAMGIWATPRRLWVASGDSLTRLEDSLGPGEFANRHYDRLYQPRAVRFTGPVDIHEIAVEATGRLVFVATAHSCLAALSDTHGFRVLWKPPFISKIAAEDRCHLNGLALQDGRPRYVSAICRSDVVNGWRARREEGGLVIDLANDRIVTEKLSMPHSPRVHDGVPYVLDSGRGRLCRFDPQTGGTEEVAFLPGFLRGLAFHGGCALATLSLPRHGAFAGLELDGDLKRRDADPWCGVQVVDLRHGEVRHWLRFEGAARECFDVAVIPDTLAPMSLGPGEAGHLTWEEGAL